MMDLMELLVGIRAVKSRFDEILENEDKDFDRYPNYVTNYLIDKYNSGWIAGYIEGWQHFFPYEEVETGDGPLEHEEYVPQTYTYDSDYDYDELVDIMRSSLAIRYRLKSVLDTESDYFPEYPDILLALGQNNYDSGYSDGYIEGYADAEGVYVEPPTINCYNNIVTIIPSDENDTIWYKVGIGGEFIEYTEPFEIYSDTNVSAYSTRGTKTSSTVTVLCEHTDLLGPEIEIAYNEVTMSAEVGTIWYWVTVGSGQDIITLVPLTQYQGPFLLEQTCDVHGYTTLNNQQSETRTVHHVYDEVFVENPIIWVWNNKAVMYCRTKDAQIRYTLDTTLPTRNSARYDGPVTLPDRSTITISAIAYLGSGSSEMVTYTTTTTDSEYVHLTYRAERKYVGFTVPDSLDTGNMSLLDHNNFYIMAASGQSWKLCNLWGTEESDDDITILPDKHRKLKSTVFDVYLPYCSTNSSSISTDSENPSKIDKLRDYQIREFAEAYLADETTPNKLSYRKVYNTSTNEFLYYEGRCNGNTWNRKALNSIYSYWYYNFVPDSYKYFYWTGTEDDYKLTLNVGDEISWDYSTDIGIWRPYYYDSIAGTSQLAEYFTGYGSIYEYIMCASTYYNNGLQRVLPPITNGKSYNMYRLPDSRWIYPSGAGGSTSSYSYNNFQVEFGEYAGMTNTGGEHIVTIPGTWLFNYLTRPVQFASDSLIDRDYADIPSNYRPEAYYNQSSYYTGVGLIGLNYMYYQTYMTQLVGNWNIEYLPMKYMFKDCNSLVDVSNYDIQNVHINGQYEGMFSGCNNLTGAPILSSTTLRTECYKEMFKDCISLVDIPELPATTLAIGCYKGMFNGCTSIEEVPELPGTNLVGECYTQMFNACSSLKFVSVSATNISNTSLYNSCIDFIRNNQNGFLLVPASQINNWSKYVNSSTIIPSTWTIIDNIEKMSDLTISNLDYKYDVTSSYTVYGFVDNPTDTIHLSVTTSADSWEIRDTLPNYITSNVTSGTSGTTLLTLNISNFNEMTWNITIVDSNHGRAAIILYNHNYTSSYKSDPLTFDILTPGAIKFCRWEGQSYDNAVLVYKINNQNWVTQDVNQDISVSLNPGDVVKIWCLSNKSSLLDQWYIKDACYLAHGNVASHKFYDYDTRSSYDYLSRPIIFMNTKLTNAKYMYYGGTVEEPAGYYLFDGCSKLRYGPWMDTSNVSDSTYYINRRRIGNYSYMFHGCTNLLIPFSKPLTFTYLAGEGCKEMFKGCTSIIDASMITIESVVTINNVTDHCYEMFYGCSNLINGPIITCTTDFDGYLMFCHCNKLISVTCLQTGTGSIQHYKWLENVSSTGTFTKASGANWSSGSWGIPTGWTVIEV